MTEHLTDPRQELARLREELAALRRDQALLETLRQQEWQCRREAERLRQAWDKEQADVDRLEGASLSALLASLTGRKEERLEQEEAEALAARLQYQSAQRQLEEVQRELEACQDRIRASADCPERYEAFLRSRQEALKAAEKGYERLMAAVRQLDKLKPSNENTVDIETLKNNCFEAINDDLNTPVLISHLFEGVRVINSIAAGHEKINEENLDKLKRLFHDFVFDILGLQSETDNNASNEALGKVIDAMMNVRKAARANKDWTTSDRIRDELKNAGIQIKDTKEGYEWSLLED